MVWHTHQKRPMKYLTLILLSHALCFGADEALAKYHDEWSADMRAANARYMSKLAEYERANFSKATVPAASADPKKSEQEARYAAETMNQLLIAFDGYVAESKKGGFFFPDVTSLLEKLETQKEILTKMGINAPFKEVSKSATDADTEKPTVAKKKPKITATLSNGTKIE